jgi:hypothetical protein
MVSSSEEPPKVKTGFFFLCTGSAFGNPGLGGMLFLRMGVGLILALDRIDVEMRPGWKPCTMLWELNSVEALMSEPMGGLVALLPRAVATVDEDDSAT